VDLMSFRGHRLSAWTALVPVAALAAGVLFATSGRTALGTDLRGDVIELPGLVAARERENAQRQAELTELQAEVEALTELAGTRDGAVAAARARGERGALSAALEPLRGPGIEITLDDAPQRADGARPNGARPDDLVIHESDVQAVVNAVWAAGADGVAIQDQRLIATSAVRCVGNTLLLHGRTWSPPFVVSAIVDPDAVRAQLAVSPEVAVLQQAVADYGLTLAVTDRSDVLLPEYDGPLVMEYATAG
jgi:uncharacterized protein YlxW (UPF0749 family)